MVKSDESHTKNYVVGSLYGGTGSVVGESEPEAIIEIKCAKGAKPEGLSGAYDARELPTT